MMVEANNNNGGGRANRPTDIPGRQAWLDERIRRGLNDGTLTRAKAIGPCGAWRPSAARCAACAVAAASCGPAIRP